MARPVTLAATKLLIQVGDGNSPEVFAEPCGLTTKGINFTKGTNDINVPDCADPEAPAWTERGVVSLSSTISGSGILAMEARATWWAWYASTVSRHCRVKLDNPTYGGYFSGLFHLTRLDMSAALGNKVAVTAELINDGQITWVPA